jgi:hypothetical protein
LADHFALSADRCDAGVGCARIYDKRQIATGTSFFNPAAVTLSCISIFFLVKRRTKTQ